MPNYDPAAQKEFFRHNDFLVAALARVSSGVQDDDYEVLQGLINDSRARVEEAKAASDSAQASLLLAEGELRTLEAIEIGTYHALLTLGC
jgi:hypothetical protein